MIEFLILLFTSAVFLLVSLVIVRSIFKKYILIGRPPVHVFYFILAKGLAIISFLFLFLRGFGIIFHVFFEPILLIDILALIMLCFGTIISYLAIIKLNKELIFGLPASNNYVLHTKGVFSISRHPLYLGFMLITLSSCIFYPNLINIISFFIIWITHYFIMNKEEEFLCLKYGEEYKQYAKKVKRFFII